MKPEFIRHLWDKFSKKYPKLACEINFIRRTKNYELDMWFIPYVGKPDYNMIDIGTNMGIFTRWMAKYAKHVHSFECNPLLFSHLNSFLPSNSTLYKCALSNKTEIASLRFDPENTGVGTIEDLNLLNNNTGIKKIQEIDVNVSRLDDYYFDKISFIKIDVEGHELHVLKGAKKLLKNQTPVLLIEIEERHCPGNLKKVPEWLSAFGYKSFVLDKGKLVQIIDISVLGAKGINNFWFIVA